MDFKNYIYLAIASLIGSSLAFLLGEEKETKKIAAKGVAGLMIGLVIVPAFMEYFTLPIQVWTGITAVASVVGIEIVILLTKKLKSYINKKIN